jgi:hypothetical protein
MQALKRKNNRDNGRKCLSRANVDAIIPGAFDLMPYKCLDVEVEGGHSPQGYMTRYPMERTHHAKAVGAGSSEGLYFAA